MTTQKTPLKPAQGSPGARIAETLERLNLEETQGAEYLGVPLSTLRKWVNGTRTPSAATIRLLDVLGTIEVIAPAIHAQFIPQ